MSLDFHNIFVYNSYTGLLHWKYAYSLDRKDPTQGYTKDNVWVISQIANAMKWDSTKEERVLFANWVLSLEGGYVA